MYLVTFEIKLCYICYWLGTPGSDMFIHSYTHYLLLPYRSHHIYILWMAGEC